MVPTVSSAPAKAVARIIAFPYHSPYLVSRATFVADRIQEVLDITGFARNVVVPAWKGTWDDFLDHLPETEDLFGGIATRLVFFDKTIIHPVVPGADVVPPVWISKVAEHVGDAAFRGFACFSRSDTITAGVILFNAGIPEIRLKPVSIDAGLGQKVARSYGELEQQVAAFSDSYVSAGITVEENLSSVVRTVDVGTYQIGNQHFSYVGTQRETLFHGDPGRWGGVAMYVRRGTLDELASWLTVPSLKTAVLQAKALDDAVDLIPGMYVTRANYDVIQGFDETGTFRSALLEQSWRIGGSSPAEVLAAKLLLDPQCDLAYATVDETFSHEAFDTTGMDHRLLTTGSYLWNGVKTYWLMRAHAESITLSDAPFLCREVEEMSNRT